MKRFKSDALHERAMRGAAILAIGLLLIASLFKSSTFMSITSEQKQTDNILCELSSNIQRKSEPRSFCDAHYELYRNDMRNIICGESNTSLISEQQSSQIIFLHYSKTGGETLEATLNVPKSHNIQYDRWREYKAPHLAVSIVRNPFDRMFSWFRFCLHGYRGDLPQPPTHCLAAHDMIQNMAQKEVLNSDSISLAFEQWLDMLFLIPKHRHHWLTFSWLEFVGGSMPLKLDYIIRFEHYAEDFAVLAKALGRNTTLAHENSSTKSKGIVTLETLATNYSKHYTYNQTLLSELLHRPYRKVYTERARKLVEMQMSADLHFFNYTF